MSKDVRCGTCKFHVKSKCEYLELVNVPAWMQNNRATETPPGFGAACKVWEPAKPRVLHKCCTCEHWSERGQGPNGYGHGPCMAPFPVWVFPEGVTSSREMAMFDGDNCEMWKWREYEEDILDD